LALKVRSNWEEVLEQEKEEIIEDLIQQVTQEHSDLFSSTLSDEKLKEAEEVVKKAVKGRKDLAPDDHEKVIASIMGQLSGYGPLKPFFSEGAEEITEVMVNPSEDGIPKVFYAKHGTLHYAGNHYFKSNEDLTRFCQKICDDIGKSFTPDMPMVDAWMADGTRVSISGFKASPLGSEITFRKSPLLRPPLPLSALVKSGTFPQFAADLMVDLLVAGHANLGVFGRTDSGKTTVLRALGEHIDKRERIIVAETSFELSFPNHPNCVNLVEVGYGDKKIVTLADICAAILRKNPDRVMVGEFRAGEIVSGSELAEATSGGFWTTLHAGDVDDLRSRLPKMFFQGGMPLPREMVDDQIRTMFHFLLFFDKGEDDSRVLMELVEVTKEGYNTVIRFDKEEFANTRSRRWIYENPVTLERLGQLAFRGAKVKPEYETVHEKYLYLGDDA